MGLLPGLYVGMGFVDAGSGANALTVEGCAAARFARAETCELNALPPAVAPGGATIVTLVTFVTLVMFVMFVVRLLIVVFAVMRIPTATTGGAPVTTAGAVPMGAGTMNPGCDPGGGGTKQPLGPMGRGPATTPGNATSTVKCNPGGGGTNATPGAAQCPATKITTPSRFS